MTPTKAEELSDWLFAFASGKAESIMLCRAAAELRRLAAVEADYARLMEKHNNLHANAARDRAERDALLEMLKEARRLVFEWGSNGQDPFDLLPQDLARIDAAIDAAMKGTT